MLELFCVSADAKNFPQLSIKIFYCYNICKKKMYLMIHLWSVWKNTRWPACTPLLWFSFLPLYSLIPPPSVSASCEVVGTQLPLPVHGWAPAVYPLWPDGCGYSPYSCPVPPPRPGKWNCNSSCQWGPGVPPEHLCTARLANSQDQTAIPVRHSIYHWWEKAWGL